MWTGLARGPHRDEHGAKQQQQQQQACCEPNMASRKNTGNCAR